MNLSEDVDLDELAQAMLNSGPFSWRVMQEGMKVASGIAPNAVVGCGEALRYAMQYSREGEVSLQTRVGKGKWREEFGLVAGGTAQARKEAMDGGD